MKEWESVVQVVRNTFKGYTFQDYIFTLFLEKMSVQRKIKKIELEVDVKVNFDDLYREADQNCRVKVKNYLRPKLADSDIKKGCVRIKGNSNDYNQEENNILLLIYGNLLLKNKLWYNIRGKGG